MPAPWSESGMGMAMARRTNTGTARFWRVYPFSGGLKENDFFFFGLGGETRTFHVKDGVTAGRVEEFYRFQVFTQPKHSRQTTLPQKIRQQCKPTPQVDVSDPGSLNPLAMLGLVFGPRHRCQILRQLCYQSCCISLLSTMVMVSKLLLRT